MDQRNRIEVKCNSRPVPFHELLDTRIVKIKANLGSGSNGTALVSMITERDGKLYEVKLEGEVTECIERGVVTTEDNGLEVDHSVLTKIKNKLSAFKNYRQLSNFSESTVEVVERNGEIVITRR